MSKKDAQAERRREAAHRVAELWKVLAENFKNPSEAPPALVDAVEKLGALAGAPPEPAIETDGPKYPRPADVIAQRHRETAAVQAHVFIVEEQVKSDIHAGLNLSADLRKELIGAYTKRLDLAKRHKDAPL